MSELKVYHHELRHNEYDEFYLKYEADKVISDLEESHKKEVEQLLMEIVKLIAYYMEACGRLQTANLIKDEQIAETRRQKYKRCLAMAMWCGEKWADIATPYGKSVWYNKWQKRWLSLANKFKEKK